LNANSNFGLGDTLYAKLSIDAGQATITDVTIDTVIVEQMGQSGITLASNGAISNTGSSVNLVLSNDFAVRTAVLSFTLANTIFPLPDQASALATISVVGLVTFANTQSRRLLMLQGTLTPFQQDKDENANKVSKLHHLSQMTKSISNGNSLALRQMKNVANAEGVDLVDSALLKLLLKQKMGVQAPNPMEDLILLRIGEHGSSSGVKANIPFIIKKK